MTEYHLTTVAESGPDADRIFKRSLVTGDLADRIRERFAATDDVYFLEDQEESGACHTCYSIDDILVIECGQHRATFTVDGELPLNKLLDWLDAPRRQAEAAAKKAARHKAAGKVMDAQIRGLVNVLEAIEAEGYTDTLDWYAKFTAALETGDRAE